MKLTVHIAAIAVAFGLMTFTAGAEDKITAGVCLPMSSGQPSDESNKDFYAGVLLAARDMGMEGVDIDLNAYDFCAADSPVNRMTYDDVMLGPVKAGQLRQMLLGVDSLTTVVSPLDHGADSLAESFTNFFQAASPEEAVYVNAVQWSREETYNAVYTIITSDYDSKALALAKKALDEKFIHYNVYKCGVSGEIENFFPAETIDNAVILAINNEAVLNNAVRNLSILAAKFPMKVYGNSKLLAYETLPLDALHKTEIRAIVPYHIDYSNEETVAFIRRFRSLFHKEPSRYAFQGYDLATFLFKAWNEYGIQWKDSIPENVTYEMLQTAFRIHRLDNGALVNYGMKRVVFGKEFKLVSIRPDAD